MSLFLLSFLAGFLIIHLPIWLGRRSNLSKVYFDFGSVGTFLWNLARLLFVLYLAVLLGHVVYSPSWGISAAVAHLVGTIAPLLAGGTLGIVSGEWLLRMQRQGNYVLTGVALGLTFLFSGLVFLDSKYNFIGRLHQFDAFDVKIVFNTEENRVAPSLDLGPNSADASPIPVGWPDLNFAISILGSLNRALDNDANYLKLASGEGNSKIASELATGKNIPGFYNFRKNVILPIFVVVSNSRKHFRSKSSRFIFSDQFTRELHSMWKKAVADPNSTDPDSGRWVKELGNLRAHLQHIHIVNCSLGETDDKHFSCNHEVPSCNVESCPLPDNSVYWALTVAIALYAANESNAALSVLDEWIRANPLGANATLLEKIQGYRIRYIAGLMAHKSAVRQHERDIGLRYIRQASEIGRQILNEMDMHLDLTRKFVNQNAHSALDYFNAECSHHRLSSTIDDKLNLDDKFRNFVLFQLSQIALENNYLDYTSFRNDSIFQLKNDYHYRERLAGKLENLRIDCFASALKWPRLVGLNMSLRIHDTLSKYRLSLVQNSLNVMRNEASAVTHHCSAWRHTNIALAISKILEKTINEKDSMNKREAALTQTYFTNQLEDRLGKLRIIAHDVNAIDNYYLFNCGTFLH